MISLMIIIKERLTALYTRFNPEKLPKIRSSAIKYAADEAKLLRKLTKKYGAAAVAQMDADALAARQLKEELLSTSSYSPLSRTPSSFMQFARQSSPAPPSETTAAATPSSSPSFQPASALQRTRKRFSIMELAHDSSGNKTSGSSSGRSGSIAARLGVISDDSGSAATAQSEVVDHAEQHAVLHLRHMDLKVKQLQVEETHANGEL